jgi:uncharacterized membrane protein YphA (DoxX/SURF4 family)
MWQALQPALADAPATALAVAVALGEIVLALLILSPRTRKAAAWLACVLHAGVLIYLVKRNWNHAVWPWNLALAASGFALIGPWRSSLRGCEKMGLAPSKPGYFAELSGHREVPVPIFSQPLRGIQRSWT